MCVYFSCMCYVSCTISLHPTMLRSYCSAYSVDCGSIFDPETVSWRSGDDFRPEKKKRNGSLMSLGSIMATSAALRRKWHQQWRSSALAIIH